MFLQERAQWLTDELFRTRTPSPLPLLAKLQEVEAEIATLADRVEAEEDARLEDESLAKTCEILLRDPVEAFDALPFDKQLRVYVLLFSGVRVEATGMGATRRWRLQRYVARIGDVERITTASPWGWMPTKGETVFGSGIWNAVVRGNSARTGIG